MFSSNIVRLLAFCTAWSHVLCGRLLRGTQDIADTPAEGGLSFLDNGTGPGQRLQVYHNNTWGTVCSLTFSTDDANVACAAILHATGNVYIAGMAFAAGAPATAMDDIPVWDLQPRCLGTELSLQDCPGGGLAKASAAATDPCHDHATDVSLMCAMEEHGTGGGGGGDGSSSPGGADGPADGTIQLGDASTTGAGYRLQIFKGGVWGTLCMRGLQFLSDATPACSSVFGPQEIQVGKLETTGSTSPALDSMPVWTLEPRCSGDEVSLGDCPGVDWANVTAATDAFCLDHKNDAALQCAIAGEGNPRLGPPPVSPCNTIAACAGKSGKVANACDSSGRTFLVCKAGVFVDRQTCWKQQRFNATLGQCMAAAQCDVARLCKTRYTGKVANACDPSLHTFVVCRNGTFVQQQACWKKQVFNSKTQKCEPACDPASLCQARFTGQVVNTCDSSRRSFVVCDRGVFVKQQVCWKHMTFNTVTGCCS